jgi:ABC-type transport system involved in multi-copper enzyme maturation permease subunit
MYAWKCWRDTRRSFLIYLILLAVAGGTVWLTGVFVSRGAKEVLGSPEKLWAMCVGMAFILSYLCAAVMAFVIGSHNIGSDIGSGTAEFLLTRPRTFRYFVWTGWAVGLAQVLLLAILSGFVGLVMFVFEVGPIWRRLPAPMHTVVEGHILDVPVLLVIVVLTSIVMYSLAYFMTVILRNGRRSLVASFAVLLGYSIFSAVLRSYAGVSLPSLTSFTNDGRQIVPLHALITPIVGWVLFALAFPFVSQVVLERYDT